MEQKVGDAHMLAAGTNRRNYQMDNLKCLLIFSVVFGHMLELFMGKNSPERVIYLVIYSFHMPLFAFVSGVFARYNPSKIKNNMIYPYLIFQTLYLLFSNQILDKDADMQYTTPYWLLWYLFAIIVWNLVLPLVQVEGMKKKMAMLLAAAAASVFIGFDEKAGYFLSASRIVEFFPYFLLGVYYRDMKRKAQETASGLRKEKEQPDYQADKRKKWLIKGAAILILGIILGAFVWLIGQNVEDIKSAWFYGSVSYEKGNYGWQFRLLSIAAALLWLAFFLLCMPVRKIPFLSYIGANTMPVYLLHGFVIKLLSKIKFFSFVEHEEAVALLFSVLLVAVFSWKPLVEFLAPLFRWNRQDFDRRGRKKIGKLGKRINAG